MSAPAAPPASAGASASDAAFSARSAALAAGLLALAIGLAIALAGGGHAAPSAVKASAPPLIHGVTLQRARCSNWLAAGDEERALAVQALASSVGAPTEYRGLRGTTLTEAETYALLDNACSRPVARGFLLYILYIRAAGYSSVLRSQPHPGPGV